MPITTVEELREHAALALRVELATIPPYLYAMWSIEDQASDAAALIRSIVAEEMLHAALVANLLVGCGGEPRFDDPELPPGYPSDLPHHRPPLRLDLAPCSMALIRDTLLVIERPEAADAEPEEDEYETLGQFYAALERAMDRLDADGALFRDHRPDRQLATPEFYGPVRFDAADSGGLLLVHDRASADEALEIIVHQGEGLSHDRWADPSHQELTHHAKLLRLAEGEVPIGPVRPAMTNPRTADLPDQLRPVSELFNGCYRRLYLTLADLYSGDPARGGGAEQQHAVTRLYGLMKRQLAGIGRYLMSQPVGDGLMAGPSFEIVDLGPDPDAALRDLAVRAVAGHPDLASVAGKLVS
jgi:rubrerythrin